MDAELDLRIPACFRHYPGAVLQLAPDGRVVDSNGVLEAQLARPIRAHPFGDLLDPASSGGKLDRLLELAVREPREHESEWELALAGADSLAEPRTFTVLRDPDANVLWLIEQRRDPRLDDLRERVTGVNSELASTQRELLKERGRLARTLEELRARGAELQRSNEALDEFAHVVSHDLKAPLRSIANHAAWLAEDLGPALSGESRRHLERVTDRVERMRAMIQGLLEYARAGRVRAQPEPVDVGELLESVVQLLDPPPGVRIQIEPGMPTLRTERAPLQQVFLNLIGNAVAHSGGRAGLIRVSGRDAGELHEFAVADDGPGIPLHLQPRIWTLFQTLPRDGTSEGSGIGLAVVRKLVELRGGTIEVASREGEGATFRFTWPKAAESRGSDGTAGRARAASGNESTEDSTA
jgi:signal transduction histidine kinase